jgi:hypothetical protein
VRNGVCTVADPPEPEAPAPEAERRVTWDDIADFRADRGVTVTEPAHVLITRLPNNLVSSARQHVVSGELLGASARVRFTPISWAWDYGDGARRTTTTGGATWQALAQPEFSTTPTSHVFAEPGDYTISVAVTLRADYSLGGGPWIPIDGSLTLPAESIALHAYTARTVLVDDDCTAAPHGPGC